MISLKYNLDLSEEDYSLYVKKIKNDVFKLLPLREEGLEWRKHLDTTLTELAGFYSLKSDVKIISSMSKLESLHESESFLIYRKTIFEVLSILDGLG
jgi:hypothetical protein